MKYELLKEKYSAENPLCFHEFESGYHAHFDAIYSEIGLPVGGGYFGGNDKGAVYVFPKRVVGDKLICVFTARGHFMPYAGHVQSISLDACRFIDAGGSEDPEAMTRKLRQITTIRNPDGRIARVSSQLWEAVQVVANRFRPYGKPLAFQDASDGDWAYVQLPKRLIQELSEEARIALLQSLFLGLEKDLYETCGVFVTA